MVRKGGGNPGLYPLCVKWGSWLLVSDSSSIVLASPPHVLVLAPASKSASWCRNGHVGFLPCSDYGLMMCDRAMACIHSVNLRSVAISLRGVCFRC